MNFFSRWRILSVVISALMIFAATSKILTESDGQPFVVGLEFAFAGLVFFLPARVAWVFALNGFVVLLAIAARAVVLSEPCGCFGPQTNPVVPFTIDLVILSALMFERASIFGRTWRFEFGQLCSQAVLKPVVVAVSTGLLVSTLVSRRSITGGMAVLDQAQAVGLLETDVFPRSINVSAAENAFTVVVFLRRKCGLCHEYLGSKAWGNLESQALRVGCVAKVWVDDPTGWTIESHVIGRPKTIWVAGSTKWEVASPRIGFIRSGVFQKFGSPHEFEDVDGLTSKNEEFGK